MSRILTFTKSHLALVVVLVLALGGTAYAASKIGAGDLKKMREVSAAKTVKPGQFKNIKANCKSGELMTNMGYEVAPEQAGDPIPQITVAQLVAQQRKGQGRLPDQALLSAANLENGNLNMTVIVTGWCLKK